MSDDSDSKSSQDPLSQVITSPPKESEKKEEPPAEETAPEVSEETEEETQFEARDYTRGANSGSNFPTGTVLKIGISCLVLALVVVLVLQLASNKEEIVEKVEEQIHKTVNKEDYEAEANQEYLISSIQVGMDRKSGADKQRKGSSISIPDIVIASINCQAKRIDELIKEGADINASDQKGETALGWAVKGSCVPAVKSLVGAGANVNLAGKDGITPMELARKINNQEIIDILSVSGK